MIKLSARFYRNVLAIGILAFSLWGAAQILKHFIDPSQVFAVLRNVSPVYAVLLIVFSSTSIITRSIRFYILLRDAEIKISYWQALKVYVSGQALSPFPGGEGSRTIFLKMETGVAIQDTFTPLIMLGIVEMIVAVIISLIGGVAFGLLRAISVGVLIGTLALIWLLSNYKIIRSLVNKLPDHPAVRKAGKTVMTTQKEVRDVIFQYHSYKLSKIFLKNLVLAFATDLFGGLIIFTAMHALNIPFGFLRSLYVFAAATVLGELVQFVPGGVGPTEGGLTGILILSGVALPQSVAVVLLFRAATLLYGITIGFVFLSIFYLKDYLKTGVKSK